MAKQNLGIPELLLLVISLGCTFILLVNGQNMNSTINSTDNPNITTVEPSMTSDQTTTDEPTTETSGGETTSEPVDPQQQTTPTRPEEMSIEYSTIEANTDIGPCTCDLTGNACDVNCCCDSDCSPDDISTFSFCNNQDLSNEDRVCFSKETIYNINNDEVTTETVGGLFCIYTDNYEDRNYYTVPDTVDSVDTFDELVTEYGSYNFAKQSETNETFGDYYKYGDKIYTLFEGVKGIALGYLGLPALLVTNACTDNNPARYLVDENTECIRTVIDLATECQTLPSLSSYSYYNEIKIVAVPAYIRDMFVNVTDYNLTTVFPVTTDAPKVNVSTQTPSTTPSLYSGEEFVPIRLAQPSFCENLLDIRTSCNISSFQTPTYNNVTETCSNVVTEVHYTITHNATDGIVDAQVLFVLSTVNAQHFPLLQKFSTSFVKFDEEDVFARSGNPGYVIGEPLIAGNLTSYEESVDEGTEEVYVKYAISLSEDRYNRMTVVTATASGTCVSDPDSRIPVVFGEDIRSGCLISVSFSDVTEACTAINAIARQALAGDMPQSMYVAMFGNSDVGIVGDWVPVIIQEPVAEPTSIVAGQCDNVILSLSIEILYANIGSLANPQAKIVGVKYTFIPGKLTYQCVGPYCQAGTENLRQKYEIASSVAFLDVSTYPDAVLAEIPPWKVELPNDFFYPLSTASTLHVHILTIMLLLMVNLLCT
ncbi:tectonic-1-like [Antedon mediterranea]|uniref:tectonic-1-like n=1 Tax=Antedon mediterranea TaxID=105859 RepID=UPI003AF750EA